MSNPKQHFNFKHGARRRVGNPTRASSPLYVAWRGMKQRCYDPGCGKYKNYGARGIRVCKRWLGPNGFYTFAKDMGEKPSPAHSLDRKNTNGDYKPSNCKWSTMLEQNKNRRKFTSLSNYSLAEIKAELKLREQMKRRRS